MSLKSGIRQRFFAPNLTTQFQVCPVPFKVDSYNGCGNVCHYCTPAGSLVWMSNGYSRPIESLKIGDEIIAFDEYSNEKKRRKLQKALVTNIFHRKARVVRLITDIGDKIYCTPDHLWLKADRGVYRSPYVGMCLTKVHEPFQKSNFSINFKLGYLHGAIDGDGTITNKIYTRKKRYAPKVRKRKIRADRKDICYSHIQQIRFTVVDKDFIDRYIEFLACFKFTPNVRKKHDGNKNHKPWYTCVISGKNAINLMKMQPTDKIEYERGWISGMFDAEGSGGKKAALRIHQCPVVNSYKYRKIRHLLRKFGYNFSANKRTITINGGHWEYLRFFQDFRPALYTRKLLPTIHGLGLHTKIIKIDDLEEMEVYSLETSSKTYINQGYASHNCFAKYFVEYSRRNNPIEEQRRFSYLEMNDPVKFKQWLDRAVSSEGYNYNRGAEVAIKERIPLKFGAVADPFPPVEIKYLITYQMLQALHEHDYPVQILTKNPAMLCRYARDFKNPNWVVSVSIISIDSKFIRTCEPGAPPPMVRLKAVEKLSAMGLPVMCKVQPAIYPRILKDLPDIVKAFKDHGAWAFNVEGLKLRVAMSTKEQETIEKIGCYTVGDDEFMGLGIRTYYRLRGTIVGPDYEITKNRKLEYINKALELADKHNIKCFVADNYIGKRGAGCECCGTEKLRDYKIWGENHRTRYFGKFPHESEHLKKVVYNSFSYSGNPNRYRTLGDIMDDELKLKKGTLL